MKYLLRKVINCVKNKNSVTTIKRNENKEIKRQIERSLWGAVSNFNIIVDNVVRNTTINILMPDITPHMSAGPLSILYFSRFLLIKGYNVRLVVDTNKTENDLRVILRQQADDITAIVDLLEVEPFPFQKKLTIIVNSGDMTVATLFNTAFHAKRIQSYCKDKKFIYFIQDDERMFFSASSLRCIVEESYNLDFYPLYSTEILKNFFIQENVGNINSKSVKLLSQGCPCNYYLPSMDVFFTRGKRKKFVFYARPHVERNCYDYAMHIIFLATEMKLFDKDWDLYGMGFPGNDDIQLANSCTLHLIPNMSLDEYKKNLPTFDVGLSLMATPHPSMPPIDLALSGCLVVTNEYKNKTTATMSSICKNIICAEMSINGIINAIKEAIAKSNDLHQRYINAKNANWPRSWDETFTDIHSEWINEIMRG